MEPVHQSFENPCELVRTTCRKWVENEVLIDDIHGGEDWNGSFSKRQGSCSVRIRRENLSGLANEILLQRTQASASDANDHSPWIEWDTEGWHYSCEGFHGSEEERRERIALYLLALDSINFCFWPMPENHSKNDAESIRTPQNNLLEYDHLALALKQMAEADHADQDDVYVFSPQNLASMTPEKMTQLFEPCLDSRKYPLPNIEKRAQLWKEVGEGLIRDHNGSALELLNRADGDASRLVELITVSFPGFRDEVYTKRRSDAVLQRTVFLKRAQIFVGDINAALGLQLCGMERLTTFADYRVPQILRHWNILEYSPGPNGLAEKVDGDYELAAGSFHEISIRAATVVSVEELVKLLNEKANNARTREPLFTDVTVDWYLWQVGERMHQEGLMKPFHKVRTHFY